MPTRDEILKEATTAHTGGPEITEFYEAYIPPPYFRPLIEDLLAFLPRDYLVGLQTVLLTNSAAVTPRQRRQKIFQRGKKHKLIEALGAYYRGTRSRQAYVALFVDNILKSCEPTLLRLSVFRRAMIAETLFHEVGHHIHAVHRPVHDGKENVAEDWERKLKRAYIRKRYWYLNPFWRPVGFLLKFIVRVWDKWRALRVR